MEAQKQPQNWTREQKRAKYCPKCTRLIGDPAWYNSACFKGTCTPLSIRPPESHYEQSWSKPLPYPNMGRVDYDALFSGKFPKKHTKECENWERKNGYRYSTAYCGCPRPDDPRESMRAFAKWWGVKLIGDAKPEKKTTNRAAKVLAKMGLAA